MNLFGYEFSLHKKALPPQTLQQVNYSGGWWGNLFGPIRESFTGAWQQNVVLAPTSTMLSFSPVYACVTGIAADVSKMRVKLSENDEGIWEEITDPHGNSNESIWIELLKQPNRYQNRIQFFQSWMISKLLYGNTYVLKQRDSNGIVTKLYILDPTWVVPLVSEDGAVYYEIRRDLLTQISENIVIPQREIIHDRMAPLWHPLVGVSPLYACGASATMGNAIQTNATRFFANRSMPGGMLTAPGKISDDVALRLKTTFTANFSGENIGKLFVAGDGLEFKPFMIDAQHAQQVEQLGWTVLDVSRAFRYPAWKIGGPMPPYAKPDLLQTAYYTDCLQEHIESIELCLDNGLEFPPELGTEFDLDSLLRMDTQALYESNKTASKFMTIDEQRFRVNLDPLPLGGDTVYLQEQDHSIEALAKRDAEANPFTKPANPALPQTTPQSALPPAPSKAIEEKSLSDEDIKAFEELTRELARI